MEQLCLLLSPPPPRFSNLVPACLLCYVFPVFAILILLLAPSCGACRNEDFRCGSSVFRYPFGKKNSGCGDPTLQLDCDHDMPLLNISGHQYYILQKNEFNFEGIYNMTIIDQNLWRERCNPSSINYTEVFLMSRQFHIVDDYINVTLWSQCPETMVHKDLISLPCNSSWYYSLNPGFNLSNFNTICKSQVVMLLVKSSELSTEEQILPTGLQILPTGFKIQLKINESCADCQSKAHGICAYDKRSMQFCCECSGKSCANKCPFGIDFEWKGKTAIIIKGVAFVALLLMGLLLLWAVYRMVWPSLVSSSPSTETKLSNVEKFLQDYAHQMPSRYSYLQLNKITNNFAHKVGEGGFGVIYKGKLPNGNVVAVKTLDRSKHSENQFMNEVATIGRIHHVNLVRLMGYCYEGIISALVYEYMSNGSMEKFIFAKRDVLSWEQLCSIALGVARGIAYLHDECNRRIIHFDIKPHNILLDADFIPKVADFGLAKLCGKKDDHISMTAARGTPGYAAPEMWRNSGTVTKKSDVYSFGMVLLEMVGGRKNIDVQVSHSSQFYFPEWAFKLLEKGQLESRVRERGKTGIECEDNEKARRLSKVGLWCIQYNSTDRPCMNRVVQMLGGHDDDVTQPPIPFKSSITAAPSINSSEESCS